MTNAAAASSFSIFAPAASAEQGQVVVSLHDVAPPTWETSAKILRELNRHGVHVCSLLVVPDYHHTGRATDDPKFVDWLRELEAAGHEIVIHGYFHERPAQQNETLRTRLLTKSYTSGEGEFYDLDYAEALRRITRARDEFLAAGLQPRGFIAPAWLLSAEAEEALRELGCEYTTRLGSVSDLERGRVFQSQSLVWSVRSAWRRQVSRAWNALLFRRLAANPLLRISIHPVDLRHPQIWRQIRALVTRALADRKPLTYHAWLRGMLSVES